MAEKLFLFDLSKDALISNLAICGQDLNDLIVDFGVPGFIIPPGPSNNPWRAHNRDGSVDSSGSVENLGYGIPLLLPDKTKARNLLDQMLQKATANGNPRAARVAGVDVTPYSMNLAPQGQHWCAGSGRGYSYATRRRAHQLIESEALVDNELFGRGVKILVIDQGFNKDYLGSLNGIYGGGMGWIVDGKVKIPGEGKWPYTSLEQRHGSMLLRSLVKLAPKAEIRDIPLIPERITDVGYFALHALFAFAFIKALYLSKQGPWVLLNAWGVVDRFAEGLWGSYTNNRDHFLNLMIASIAEKHDVVFAAGNNGQFCADPRATGYDAGPGNSIFGANGLPEVTSVGAVRADGAWIGASSQGPGPEDFQIGNGTVEKPDFCVPSWFTEDHDHFLRSGGTSAASALTAGCIAALRQGWGTTAVSPAELRAAIRNSSRQVAQTGWSARTGTGVLKLGSLIGQPPIV
ncbi:S8/S53 family peptidase [Ruegeria arenilitoris]|uniref:S8/S53 family peptidase n=1 Tax=Ruegeria arenilitoris TaxID=1173585 RepID=UPI00147F2D1A|nr:S8/S53 family peptidase [Ruegeria arenilitoris]